MSATQGLYLVGVALCLFSSGVLGARTTGVAQPLRWFVVYLALESTCFLFELLMAHPATPLKALWLAMLMSTSLLIAPCLWLAMRECVTGARPSLAAIGTAQRLVIAAGVLLTLPLLQTAHFGTAFAPDPPREPTPLGPLVHPTMVMCLAIFATQVPVYLWRCRELLSELPNETRGWLHVPLLIVGTTWLIGVLRTLVGMLSRWSEEFAIATTLIDVSVTIAAVFWIVSRVASQAPRRECGRAPEPVEERSEIREPPKYLRSPLDSSQRERVVRKLRAACDERQIHLECDLSLARLSRHIGESEHCISQVLSQSLDCTFHDFVNRHRVEYAQRLLASFPNRSVLEIATEAGFNAKSTFNHAFRRHTGMTPRQFRAHLLALPTPQDPDVRACAPAPATPSPASSRSRSG